MTNKFVPISMLLVLANMNSTFGSVAQLNVTGTVQPLCSLNVITNINFGAYNSTNAVTSVGELGINCNSNTNVTINIDGGMNNSSSVRRMISGSDFLTYEVYQDSAMQNIFNTQTISNVSGTQSNVSVYGKIPPGQNVTSGTYNDTLNVTLAY